MASRSSCVFALLHRRPGRCTSAAPAPRSTTGCSPAAPATDAAGTLLLRIEDTDRERSTAGERRADPRRAALAEPRLGRGPGLPVATRRRHREVLAQLLADGHAYHSTATADDVKAYKAAARRRSRLPRRAGGGRARFACTSPTRATRSSTTSIRGEISFPNASIDDPVIARADGSVLYNFAVAVDDLDARHHPRRARRGPHLQHAQAAARVRGAGRRRRRATRTCRCCTARTARSCPSATAPPRCRSCATRGYLPEAVDNYIALLGAGFAADEEFFTLDELAERFRLERVSKNPAVFDERKLRHINGRHLRELSIDELTARLEASPGAAACAARSRSHARRSRRWPTSGRLSASCSTARPTTRRRSPR